MHLRLCEGHNRYPPIFSSDSLTLHHTPQSTSTEVLYMKKYQVHIHRQLLLHMDSRARYIEHWNITTALKSHFQMSDK